MLPPFYTHHVEENLMEEWDTITKGLLSIAGILLNSTIIYITIRAPWLNGNCNILLALYEFCLLAFDLNDALDLFLLIYQGNSDLMMTNRLCFIIMGPRMAIYSAVFVLMVAIAFDRLFSAICPIRQLKFKRPFYFLIIFGIIAANASILIYLALQAALNKPTKLIECGGIESTLDMHEAVLYAVNLIWEIVAISAYMSLWMVISRQTFKIKNNHSLNQQNNRHMLRTLFFILLTESFGFIPVTVYRLTKKLGLITKPKSSTEFLFVIETVAKHLAHLASCSNAIILFNFSNDYRRAFINFIPFLGKLFGANGKGNTTVVTNVKFVSNKRHASVAIARNLNVIDDTKPKRHSANPIQMIKV